MKKLLLITIMLIPCWLQAQIAGFDSKKTTAEVTLLKNLPEILTTPVKVVVVDTAGKVIGYYTLSGTGGSGTPGGTSGQIQYNNAGAFGGFGNWDGATLRIDNTTGNGGLLLRNTTPAPVAWYSYSEKLSLEGKIWNSAQGSKVMSAYLQVRDVVRNTNPTTSKLSFFVGSDSNEPAEQMYITSAGTFGILGGANFAGTTLNDVNSVYIRNTEAASVDNEKNSNKLVFEGRAWNSGQGNIAQQGYIQLLNTTENINPLINRIGFFTQAGTNAGAFTERLSIENTGNVGIGVIDPSYKLDVGGDGNFTGDVTVQPEVYSTSWDGSNEVPTKNDVYDKMETISGGSSFSGASVYINYDYFLTTNQTAIPFNSEEFDTSNFHDNSTNNSRLTAPEDGYYQVIFNFNVYRAGSFTYIYFFLKKNGSTNIAWLEYSNTWGQTEFHSFCDTRIVYLNAGDYLELYGWTTDVNVARLEYSSSGRSSFQIKKQ